MMMMTHHRCSDTGWRSNDTVIQGGDKLKKQRLEAGSQRARLANHVKRARSGLQVTLQALVWRQRWPHEVIQIWSNADLLTAGVH